MTNLYLNMTVAGASEELLAEIKALVAQHETVEVTMDRSFAERPVPAGGVSVFLHADPEDHLIHLRDPETREVLRRLSEDELEQVRGQGACVEFNLPFYDPWECRLPDPRALVLEFGFTPAPEMSVHGDFWEAPFKHEFEVVVPVALRDQLFAGYAEEPYETEGTLIEDQLSGRRTQYLGRQRWARRSYSERWVCDLLAA